MKIYVLNNRSIFKNDWKGYDMPKNILIIFYLPYVDVSKHNVIFLQNKNNIL